MKKYLLNILIAVDQLVNALLGGSPDETLSARAWRAETQAKRLGLIFRPLIDFLFLPFEKEHCYQSWVSEVRRKQLHKSYQ
jgi:hypothetical protein